MGDVKEQFGGCLNRHLWAVASWHLWVNQEMLSSISCFQVLGHSALLMACARKGLKEARA